MICKHMHIMNLNECKSLKSIRGPTSLGIHPPKELVQQPIFTWVSSSFDDFSLPVVMWHATHFYKRVNILVSLLFSIWWLSTLTSNTNPDCLTVYLQVHRHGVPGTFPPPVIIPNPRANQCPARGEKGSSLTLMLLWFFRNLKMCFKF